MLLWGGVRLGLLAILVSNLVVSSSKSSRFARHLHPMLLKGGFEGPSGEGLRQHRADEDELEQERAANSPVIGIPRDFATLQEAFENVMKRPVSGLMGSSTIISICAGSHLMPRRYKIVSAAKDCWQYWQSYPPDWVDGKCSLSRIPDDGCQPQLSASQPCDHLPTRGTRFFNITKPIQVLGSSSSPQTPQAGSSDRSSRVCGSWHLHLPPMSAGSFRRVACVNQEDCVMLIVSGAWRVEECELMSAGMGATGADVVHVKANAQVIMFRTLVQPLRRGPPCDEWAAWPPGSPSNGGGYLGLSGVPANMNPSPQDGYAMFGVFASDRSKCMVEECSFRGLVCGVASADTSDVALDWCQLSWNQYASAAVDSSRLILRSCDFEDNVFGAVVLWDVHAIPNTQIAMLDIKVRGKLWGSDLRPEELEEFHVQVSDSPDAFLQGPGRHGAEGYFKSIIPKKAGKWQTNWTEAMGFAGVPDGKGGWKGDDAKVLNSLMRHRPQGSELAVGDLWANTNSDIA